MISYNSLGITGRLGNQMFQYASLKGIARNNGYEFCIPHSINPEMDSKVNHQLFLAFDLKNVHVGHLNVPDIDEEHFHFNENLYNNCPDNVNLAGYFQSYKYFQDIQDEIKLDFEFKNKQSFIDEDCSEFTSIHIRRGDYLYFSDYHPLCDLSYYYEAMKIIGLKNKFLIFSDDIDWCKQQEIFSKNCLFADTRNNLNDLYLMTKCKNNIIANSSYSWWGAWLNNNTDKIIISPDRWFGPALNHNLKDLRPKDWIIV